MLAPSLILLLRPDITVLTDWALKINDIFFGFCLFVCFVLLLMLRINVYAPYEHIIANVYNFTMFSRLPVAYYV